MFSQKKHIRRLREATWLQRYVEEMMRHVGFKTQKVEVTMTAANNEFRAELTERVNPDWFRSVFPLTYGITHTINEKVFYIKTAPSPLIFNCGEPARHWTKV